VALHSRQPANEQGVGPGLRTTVAIAFVALTTTLASTLVSCQSGPPKLEPLITDAALGPEPDIRVRLERAATSVTVSGPTAIAVVGIDDDGRPVRFSTPVRFSIVGDAVVASASGLTRSFSGPVRVTAAGGGMLRVGDTVSPGDFLIYPRSSVAPDAMDVVAELPMEAYLPGVLAKELYQSWPLEAFEAQAVAARSYALHERSRARAKGRWFDVESTTLDQAYLGATEHARSHDAVLATRGQTLMHKGVILRSYYSSTCGGRPASAADQWPTEGSHRFNLAAPIQASFRTDHCQDSPAYRWERTRSARELSNRIRAWGKSHGHAVKSIGTLDRVEVREKNELGRPTSYLLTDRRGDTFTIQADSLRMACNSDAPGEPPVTRETRVRSGDLSIRVNGNRVTINGRGFGHGVGMCQFGTAALAREGWTHREILTHYYPGARIERLY